MTDLTQQLRSLRAQYERGEITLLEFAKGSTAALDGPAVELPTLTIAEALAAEPVEVGP